ncbi:uncharacterized protein K489DRAFT_376355 [Dissoconium aciculare CBS 342.82]|uniref:Uncharacterized protein n=1 Tax=Dissoconium aciculare CBS 342.82 TaxID=1314786 RepID=A0A6J3MD70_9PEZI|nr:uncharacterized protein K489DRAFT_376355 [Dissoconium aciculare CBS 342.82]KAF1825961.1 hypothetical protein K489DRAFT_376355 [Dissoconium aciculare CBS 342.82]
MSAACASAMTSAPNPVASRFVLKSNSRYQQTPPPGTNDNTRQIIPKTRLDHDGILHLMILRSLSNDFEHQDNLPHTHHFKDTYV